MQQWITHRSGTVEARPYNVRALVSLAAGSSWEDFEKGSWDPRGLRTNVSGSSVNLRTLPVRAWRKQRRSFLEIRGWTVAEKFISTVTYRMWDMSNVPHKLSDVTEVWRCTGSFFLLTASTKMQQGRDKPGEGPLNKNNPGMVAFESPRSLPRWQSMLKLTNGFWGKAKSRAAQENAV